MGLKLRRAGRVVVVDEQDRLLLFSGTEVGGPRRQVWYLPGGGTEGDETDAEAARREFWEETGRRVELGPKVWVRRRLRADGTDSRSSFFLVRIPHFEFDPANVPHPGEVDTYRWWTLAQIEQTGPEAFIPRRLAELLGPILGGDVPAEPVDASD